MVSHQSRRSRRVRRQENLAQLRWHQLRRRSLGEWREGRATIKGAFTRGIFDISRLVTPGQAGRARRPRFSAAPSRHSLSNTPSPTAIGSNGGLPAIDGPTFLCSIGWDWIPAIRDRDTGIWQKVTLSASGPAVLQDPAVTSDLSLPSLASADIADPDRISRT